MSKAPIQIVFGGSPSLLREREPLVLPRDLAAEPIEGWRIWRVKEPASITLPAAKVAELCDRVERGENPLRGLASAALCAIVVRGDTWVGEQARCRPPGYPFYGPDTEHEPPGVDCGCGYWALKTEEQMLDALARVHTSWIHDVDEPTWAYGRVQLWGRVVEHNSGYRGQFARPTAVTLVEARLKDEQLTERRLRGLRDRYGCDVNVAGWPDGVLEQSVRFYEEHLRRRRELDERLREAREATDHALTRMKKSEAAATRSNRFARWFWPGWGLLNAIALVVLSSWFFVPVIVVSTLMTAYHWRRSGDRA